MYSVFLKNLNGFEVLFKNDERLLLSKPLYLLKNIDTFNEHKIKMTNEYLNLYAIIEKANQLKGTNKYHGLGMFLNELYLQHFDFTLSDSKDSTDAKISTIISSDDTICETLDESFSEELIQYQFDLLYQFMFPAYYK